MKTILLFLLLPFWVFSQDKSQKTISAFVDFRIETDNNLFSYKQDLNILNPNISDNDIQLNKEFYYQKSENNPFNYRFEKKPLHNNPLHYYHDYEYQMMGGSKGLFYNNLLGGLIESIFGELSIKL